MRTITKSIHLIIDGQPMDFRLKKLDAFSGVQLMRLLARQEGEDFTDFFLSLPPADIRSLMVSCLNHAEVLLPAGYIPVMTGEDWSWPDLQYDTATCLKLTLEVSLWTLQGFFGAGGTDSRPAAPDTPPQCART